MNDWRLVVSALGNIVKKSSCDLSLPPRAGPYAGARTMLADRKEFTHEEAGGNTYALEKIASAKWHIGAALGFDIDNEKLAISTEFGPTLRLPA